MMASRRVRWSRRGMPVGSGSGRELDGRHAPVETRYHHSVFRSETPKSLSRDLWCAPGMEEDDAAADGPLRRWDVVGLVMQRCLVCLVVPCVARTIFCWRSEMMQGGPCRMWLSASRASLIATASSSSFLSTMRLD